MSRTAAFASMVVMALAASAAMAQPAPPAPATEHGQQVFRKWCAPCHGPSPRLAGTLALQNKYKGEIPAALEQRTDLTPEIVSYFVRNGVAWMAPFRKTEVSDAELADLAAYLSKKPAGKQP
jgi:mono/diheme cytochrome c family protein